MILKKRCVCDIDGCLRILTDIAIRFCLRYGFGANRIREGRTMLVHEGIVPTIHPTLALGCRHVWNAEQDSFAPELANWGETSKANIFVVGDGAGIGGATAACLRGKLAGSNRIQVRAAVTAGSRHSGGTDTQTPQASPCSPPLCWTSSIDLVHQYLFPPDHTIACRCEEVSWVGRHSSGATAAGVRTLNRNLAQDPDFARGHGHVA